MHATTIIQARNEPNNDGPLGNPARLFEYRDHWLVQRSDTPNFHIYWCREGTRRVRRASTGTSDLEEAKRRLIEFVDRRTPAPLLPVTPCPSGRKRGKVQARPFATEGQHEDHAAATVGHSLLRLLAEYVEWLAPRRSAFANGQCSLRAIAEFCARHDIVYLHEFNLNAQERFIAWRRGQLVAKGHGASNGTINRDFSVIKAALGLAYRRGLLDAVPYLSMLPQPPARDRFLTPEECRRLIDACEPPYVRRFVLLMLHTLQRPKAIFGLRVEQVDLVNRRIDFLAPGMVQTNKRRPVVPITPTLANELERAIRESKSGYIVEKDGLPLQSMRKAFASVVRKAGLEDVTPYVLRHTGATILAVKGVSMHQIASMLGHTTQRTTDVYVKRRPEFLAEAVGTLESLLGSMSNDTAMGASNALTNLRAKPAHSARQTRASEDRELIGSIAATPQAA